MMQYKHRNSLNSAGFLLAGRAPLRLVMFGLPTHREVMTASQRISAIGCFLFLPSAPVRRAACLRPAPPRHPPIYEANRFWVMARTAVMCTKVLQASLSTIAGVPHDE